MERDGGLGVFFGWLVGLLVVVFLEGFCSPGLVSKGSKLVMP